MRTVLLAAGALLPVVASGVYIASILKGRTRPQRTTRLLLLIITALTLGSLVAGHDTSGVWLALVSCVQSAVIWALSLWRGMGGKGKLDWLCFMLCGVGVIVWLLSGQSTAGLVASIVADLVAIIPSLHKTVRMPHTESLAFFAVDAVAGLFVVAAGPYTWQAALFPAYIFLINTTYAVIIFTRHTIRNYPPTAVG